MLPEQDFKKVMREYLAGEVPDEVRENIERLEMEMASPGDWDRTKQESGDQPETGENDKGEVSQWLENLLVAVRNNDEQVIQESLQDGWPADWDADIDDMTYAGREDDPEMLRQIVDTFRAFGSKSPTPDQIRQALQKLKA
jgi:hypothetical protein